jgi:hypothetical protein
MHKEKDYWDEEEIYCKYSIGDLILVKSTTRVRQKQQRNFGTNSNHTYSSHAYIHATEHILGSGVLLLVLDYQIISGHLSYVMQHPVLGEIYSDIGEIDCPTVLVSSSTSTDGIS